MFLRAWLSPSPFSEQYMTSDSSSSVPSPSRAEKGDRAQCDKTRQPYGYAPSLRVALHLKTGLRSALLRLCNMRSTVQRSTAAWVRERR